jgi:hypothetical protein
LSMIWARWQIKLRPVMTTLSVWRGRWWKKFMIPPDMCGLESPGPECVTTGAGTSAEMFFDPNPVISCVQLFWCGTTSAIAVISKMPICKRLNWRNSKSFLQMPTFSCRVEFSSCAFGCSRARCSGRFAAAGKGESPIAAVCLACSCTAVFSMQGLKSLNTGEHHARQSCRDR